MLAISIVGVALELPALQWSGFMDYRYVLPEDKTASKGFRLEQWELGVSSKLSGMVSVEGALALGDKSFELGSGIINIHVQESWGIIIGQFDIPIGRDFNYYPSPERALVSLPLLNEKTYNGWKDTGFKTYVNVGPAKVALYLVNGIAPTRDQQAVGAKVTWALEKGEMGLSYVYDGTMAKGYFGLDGLYTWDSLEVMAEVLQWRQNSQTNLAYYVQTKYSWSSLFGVCRYDNVSDEQDTDGDGFARLSQLSLGFGWNIDPSTVLKAEYQLNGENGARIVNDKITLQAVTSF